MNCECVCSSFPCIVQLSESWLLPYEGVKLLRSHQNAFVQTLRCKLSIVAIKVNAIKKTIFITV